MGYTNDKRSAGGGAASTAEAIVDDFGPLAIVDDGVVLEFPTSTSPVTITLEDCDGSLTGSLDPPRSLTITTTSSTGSYSTAPWTITSTAVDDSTITDTPALLQANGGETRETTKVHGDIVTIQIPAMSNTSGTIKIGVGGKVGLRHKPFKTAVSEQPYAVPHANGEPAPDATVVSIAASGAPPYGALDFTTVLDGSIEVGASYAKDLS